MALDIVSKLNDIVPNPGCVYDALESILESCQTPERVEERTWLGIKLSICEFEAANVKYPTVCTEEWNLSHCTQLLESKATWWTTFSGNYRHISAICLEYQPQFEAQKLVGVFKNASELFAGYQNEIDHVLEDYRSARTDSLQQWQRQSRELSVHLADLLLNLNELKQLVRSTGEEADGIVAPITAFVSLAEEKLGKAVNTSEILSQQSKEVSERLDTFTLAMMNVEARHISAADTLQTTVNSTMGILKREVRDLQQLLGGLKVVLGVLGAILRLSWPLFVLLGLIYLSSLLSRNRPRHRLERESHAEVETDLMFF